MRLNVQGLVAAVFTPMRADGELNLDLIERQAEDLVRRGVAGAFVCGTTGEGQSLTSDERRRIAERWTAVAPRAKLAVIVHVGHASLSEARMLAAHAARAGAAGLAATPPYYFKPQTIEDVVECAAQVASAAPQTPFYYYHIPSMTGVAVPAARLLELAAPRIPNLAGLKFTDDNLSDFGRCLALAGDRMDLFLGREGMMLGALATGARAAVGSSLNFAAPIYRRLIRSFESGDLAAARQCQARATRMLSVLVKFGGVRAMKAAMNLLGGADYGPVRLPLRPLGDAEQSAMRQELEAVDFLELTRPESPEAR